MLFLFVHCTLLIVHPVQAVDLTPEQLLEVATLAKTATEAADALANLEAEIKAIGRAADTILGGGDDANKLIASLTTAAQDTSNPKKTRILSIQSLADIVVALGQEGTSQKDLSKRLAKVIGNVCETVSGATETSAKLDAKLKDIGAGPFGDAQETVFNAHAQLAILNGQIKRYQDVWKKELEKTEPTPSEPRTLKDKIVKLGKDVPGREESAASVLFGFVKSGYPSGDELPSPSAISMSRVAFDAIKARPASFVSRLKDLIDGEPVDVVDLQRRVVHALAGLSAEEARSQGTQVMIGGAFTAALNSSDRLTRILGADGVVAMVTAEEAAKRSGLVTSITELLDGETDVAVKSRLTRALQLIASDVRETPNEESASVGTPASASGESSG